MAITRTNRQRNPSSEVTGTLTQATTCTLARVAFTEIGTYTQTITASGASPWAATPGGNSGLPVTAGETITSSVHVRHSAASARQMATQVMWYNAGGALLSTSTAAYVSVSAGSTLTRLSTTVVAPTNAAYAAQRVSITGAVSGEVFVADGWLFESGSALGTYFDGSTAASGATWYEWTGVAHSSTSVQHVAAFTATPDPARGAVTLRLVDAPNGPVAGVNRFIDGGPAAAVRQQPGIGVGYAVSGEYTLTDFDVPPSANRKPIVYTITPAGGVALAAAAVTFTAAATVLPWTFPEKVLPVPLITGFRHSRSTTDQVHNILGATNPAVTVGDGRPASGSMELWAPTLADALALETLLLLDTAAKGDVFLLRGPVGDPWRLFFKPTRVEVEPASWMAPAGSEGLRWTVRVEFTAMPEQTGPRG